MEIFKFALGKVLGVLVIASAAVLLGGLWLLQILPEAIFVAIGVLLVLLTALVVVLTWSGQGKVRMSIGIVLAVLLIIVLTIGAVYIWQAVATIDNITAGNTETVHVGIYVRSDDTREFDDSNAAGYQYGILQTVDRESTDGALQQLNERLNTQVTCREYQRLPELIDALLEGEVDAIVLNQAFLEMMEEMPGYEEKLAQIREAFLQKVEVEIVPPPESTEPTTGGDKDDPPVSMKNNAFIVYISGIDTYGKVSTRSRSDVNILAVVNPKTRQVLLVSTPRDYFVPLSISNGIRDKLTHAGIYGVNVSKETLNMLYDINIDYHFRVNFSGFEKIVDALDGVTVYSDYSFTTLTGYSFQKGANRLNGKAALAFSRERNAFGDGDHQRGRNQMAMIKAVIDKALSPTLLTNYTQILNAVEGSFEMSIPMDVIGDLVSKQLSEGGAWNVVTYSVSGSGGYETTYSAAEELWVMYPDQSTVDHAKQLIRDVMEGKVVTP